MSLTKDDLQAISAMIDAAIDKKFQQVESKLDAKLDKRFEELETRIDKKTDEKLAPIHETLKELLKGQFEIVKRIDYVEFQIEGLKADFYQLRHDLIGFKFELATLKSESRAT